MGWIRRGEGSPDSHRREVARLGAVPALVAPGFPGETTEVAGKTKPPSYRGHPVPVGYGTGMMGPCDQGPARRKYAHCRAPPWAPGFPGTTIEVAGKTKTPSDRGHPVPVGHGTVMRGPCDQGSARRKYAHRRAPPWAPGFPGETIEVAGKTKTPSYRGHPVPVGLGTGTRRPCDSGPLHACTPTAAPHRGHRVSPVRR